MTNTATLRQRLEARGYEDATGIKVVDPYAATAVFVAFLREQADRRIKMRSEETDSLVRSLLEAKAFSLRDIADGIEAGDL